MHDHRGQMALGKFQEMTNVFASRWFPLCNFVSFAVVFASYVFASEPRLDAFRQRLEVRDALHLVIRQFDIEVLLEARQQAECLQAVDAKLLKKIIIRRQSRPWHFELRGGQI